MTHLDEGLIQALMDDELATLEADEAMAHVRDCARCRGELEAARARAASVSGALAALDPVPPVDRVRERVAAEAARRRRAAASAPEAGAASPRPDARRAASRRWAGPPAAALARAAAITLLLAGGAAAAALPGSPLRQWITGEASAPEVAEAPAAAEEAADEEVGARVTPVSGRVRISLEGLAPGAELHVTRVDGAGTASAFVPNGASFRVGDGVLEVTTARGPVRVELPREVEATVSVDGRTYLESGPDGVRAHVPVAELDGDRLLLLVP